MPEDVIGFKCFECFCGADGKCTCCGTKCEEKETATHWFLFCPKCDVTYVVANKAGIERLVIPG